MTHTFFTSDYHLDHANIIQYANRPYIKYEDLNEDMEWISEDIKNKRCQEMNMDIIKRHNARVKEDDLVYHLGDFCFKYPHNAQYWESVLNGKIVHILGNHDKNNGVKSLIKYAIMEFGGVLFYVTHIPPEERQVDTLESHIISRCNAILCGHVHNLWAVKKIEMWNNGCKVNKYAINVGLDVWDYQPVSISSILKLLANLNKGKLMSEKLGEYE